MQQVTEVYEARVMLGRFGNLSFSVLFCGRPSSRDLIAAIEHKRITARVFKLASPDSFVEVVKRLGMPVPNHAIYNTEGDCIHVLTVDLYPVQSGEIPQAVKPKPKRHEQCALCHLEPTYRTKGNEGLVLYHHCPGDSSSTWFPDEVAWTERNERLRRKYK